MQSSNQRGSSTHISGARCSGGIASETEAPRIVRRESREGEGDRVWMGVEGAHRIEHASLQCIRGLPTRAAALFTATDALVASEWRPRLGSILGGGILGERAPCEEYTKGRWPGLEDSIAKEEGERSDKQLNVVTARVWMAARGTHPHTYERTHAHARAW